MTDNELKKVYRNLIKEAASDGYNVVFTIEGPTMSFDSDNDPDPFLDKLFQLADIWGGNVKVSAPTYIKKKAKELASMTIAHNNLHELHRTVCAAVGSKALAVRIVDTLTTISAYLTSGDIPAHIHTVKIYTDGYTIKASPMVWFAVGESNDDTEISLEHLPVIKKIHPFLDNTLNLSVDSKGCHIFQRNEHGCHPDRFYYKHTDYDYSTEWKHTCIQP